MKTIRAITLPSHNIRHITLVVTIMMYVSGQCVRSVQNISSHIDQFIDHIVSQIIDHKCVL